ncbi:hypothetical protein HQR03_06420 [Psychrobacter okhotskensis]|uniref:hypothetical protein n=1 Tax=Psychrobacter okhotskensis TaxID=212403 RepID=UPI001565BDD0|nr:hypothetical protein [Psychrobacter okhotskensis]NRD70168.1 hypothetical protein [Psychrobacter okhotskensis]
MKNRTLPLSLLIGAMLTIPSLAMAAPADTAQADMQNAATTTLETEAENSANVSVPNPSNSVQINETQRISRASVNSNATQQQMAPEQQAMQQAQQQAMQDSEEAMPQKDLQEDMSQEDMLDEESMLEEEASSESQEEL